MTQKKLQAMNLKIVNFLSKVSAVTAANEHNVKKYP